VKIFTISVTHGQYEIDWVEILGVFRLGQFERFIELIKKNMLSDEQKKHFNMKHVDFDKWEKELLKVTNALNLKENKTWSDGISHYLKTSFAKELFRDFEGFEVECHWLSEGTA
jgi:hypothetical protein